MFKTSARLDRIYSTVFIAELTTETLYEETALSDHKMVTISFISNIFELQHGFSYWKFDVTYLKIDWRKNYRCLKHQIFIDATIYDYLTCDSQRFAI